MAMLRVISCARSGALLFVSAAALGAAASPAAAQVVTIADLVPRLVDVEDGVAALDATVAQLRTDTTGNASALTAQASVLSGLRTDLGGLNTRVAGVDTDVASLKVQVGELRGVLDALPEIVGPNGPLDLPGIIDRLNTQTLANATSLAKVNLDVTTLQNNVVTEVARLDDHERRITRNTADIQRHELAITDLQSQMASGFAGVQKELRNHDRRIEKATEGVAMAFAMKSPTVPDTKNFAISGSFGAFEDKTALAFSGGVRATDALQLDAGIAVGLDEGSVGGRAGATLAW